MESEGVSLPNIHEHLMVPWNDFRRGDCCRCFKASSDGYYCKSCDFFVHKKCCESPEDILHPSHPNHYISLQCTIVDPCYFCGDYVAVSYRCGLCNFYIDLKCANNPPPEVIGVSEMHHHKLTFLKETIEFDCDAKCGKNGYGFHYKCNECDISFHVDCVLHPPEVDRPLEVNHSYHSIHPLKLFRGQPPDYSDGKCRLCNRKTIYDGMFYHCYSCNFTLDMRCVLNPPPHSLLDLKTHDHQLTILPRLFSFACNACGLKGDRSPYVCFQCDFMIHQDCVGLPRIININRHDHRVSRTSILGVVNSVCGVCRQKVDWTCGGYSCQKCPGYVVHSKCATRKDVWNGNELEGVPEEEEDIEPYVVIDDNTIQHFSHKEHHLRLNVNGLLCDEKRCSACIYPICLQSFYSCMDCDYILHQKCAELLRRKWHVLHNERLALVTDNANEFTCRVCSSMSNGFRYNHGWKTSLDVICGSISEPFVHPSHPHHPLYCIPEGERKSCNCCNKPKRDVLRCIEDGCEFVLDFKCATLPIVVKHRVDDHPILLCYGEKASDKLWCDICEKETNPKTWFYTSKDYRASLHIECVLGEFARLMPGSRGGFTGRLYKVVQNNSLSRPICMKCKSRCILPIILKMFGTEELLMKLRISEAYFCSFDCINTFYPDFELFSNYFPKSMK